MARHALKVLNQLREYDSFLDSLHTIVDMGCGTGEDITWWATLESRDEPPVPYNYNCFAIDRDAHKLSMVPDLVNIHKLEKDFNTLFSKQQQITIKNMPENKINYKQFKSSSSRSVIFCNCCPYTKGARGLPSCL